ncbi:MAG: FAD/NAD(P)-binding protein [Sphingomonas sp.]
MIGHVAIVGAGFSGTLQAIHLLRPGGPKVSLIERRGEFARGVAYSTADPGHLLNVRAANMSALPDRPDHFVDWRAAQGGRDPATFASRIEYGDYLGHMLREAAAAAPGRLELRHDTVADMALRRDGVELLFDSGGRLRADAAVLALGNLPPHDPPVFAGKAFGPDRYVSDPWSADFCAGLRPDDTVLLIGTGLTMIDTVLTLEARGFAGRIVALSRRGLMPRAHHALAPAPGSPTPPVSRGAALVRAVRQRAAAIGWREAVDELRPHTQGLWRSATLAEQRRFVRHLRPWWDAHRHRLAPEIAARIDGLRRSGRLDVVAGGLRDAVPEGEGALVTWRSRGEGREVRLDARRIINCTGPQGDLLRTQQPLLRLLLASGCIRPDPHRFGIDVDAGARVIDVKGQASTRLFALGPMTRGAFWEMVAVPDIRVQTWAVAEHLISRTGDDG